MTEVQESAGKARLQRPTFRTYALWIVLGWSFLGVLASRITAAEIPTVHGTVRVLHHAEADTDSADVVVWLSPLTPSGPVGPGPTARLMQKNKKFIPHVVAVTQGTEIEFPNQDLFFHNVFSMHQGKTLDLGLYESGAARKVRFSQAGISYIFCNIHPQMSAAVVVLKTRYFAVTDEEGQFQITRVPPGRYRLSVWYELASDSELRAQGKEVEVVAGDNEISGIVLHSTDAPQEHPNKDGDSYYSSSPKTR